MSVSFPQRTAIATAVIFLAGCATTAPEQKNDPLNAIKQTFASDDPCSNNARNIGIVGGAIVGTLLGNALGGGKDESKLVGAALGGLLGGLIGADMDRKRCELSKVAKQYNLDITFADIRAEGNVKSLTPAAQDKAATNGTSPAVSPKSAEAVIGNTVTVRDKEGSGGHFEVGSDKLTHRAQEYFAAIAAQYAPDTIVATQTGSKQKDAARQQLAQRRILLVGHTDDTGVSRSNADLSERRARAVAAFLKTKGVPETGLYYQGAGETLPIADNRTEEGRSVNRRVEIVELATEDGFKKYLETRKPEYGFYRPKETAPVAANTETKTHSKTAPPASGATSAANTSAVVVKGKSAAEHKGSDKAGAPPSEMAMGSATSNPQRPQASPPPGRVLDFGGVPYTAVSAKLDTGMLIPEKKFSLISSAYADNNVVQMDCSFDRPRNTGTVKSLQNGTPYRTSEHLPQLYGKTWAINVNGNLVVLNRLAVLRDGGVPANLPELKVYAQYKPGSGKKPDVQEEPPVNSYLVDKGVLYRVFPRSEGGMQCMDILFALDGSTTAKAGKLIYAQNKSQYVADFKPAQQ